MMLKHLLVLITTACAFIHALDTTKVQFLQTSQVHILYIPPQAAGTPDHMWETFENCALRIYDALEETRQEKKSFILIMPAQHHISCTIAPDAPIIEGSRVALAWVSSYFRFAKLGNVDVRVVLLPHELSLSEQELTQLVSQTTDLTIIDSLAHSPEQRMASRILHYQDIVTTSPASTVELIAYEPCVKTHPINLIQAPFTAALRIVITGGAGFLGSHMCKELVSQGHQVIVLDTLICSSRNNIAELENSPHFAFYNVDVTKPYDIAGPIDLVVHLASCPSPEFYYNNPIETLMSGLQGTKYALELALRKNARFMIGSTSEVYGDPEVSPQCEEYPGRVSAFGKRSQYDQSKRGAETLIKLYFERHNIDIRIARIFNTYGPAMALHDGRVVTNFIAAILEDKPVTVYGDGLQTRSFAYASDTVDGLIGLAFTDRITECPCIDQRIFNVGTPQEFTIKELADEINLISLKYLSKPAHIRYVPNIDPDDPKKRNPDITKINKLIGYEPLVRLKEGLEKTFLFFYHRAH